mmetsp:Transcript_64248/g.150880  ORF Transcript_64248/g.150880 Transcript_64248/m.150880 type:complete len:230 (+) Transcript_64248:1539-2228(+)
MKRGTRGERHSKRYRCSSKGISTMARKTSMSTGDATGGSANSGSRSNRFWIHSVSCCRSSTGMGPSVIASGLEPQVGILSFSTLTKSCRSSPAWPCAFATSSSLSIFSMVNCVRRPDTRIISSSASPRHFAPISGPNLESFFSIASSAAFSTGKASATSNEKRSLLSRAVQKSRKQKRDLIDASMSGHRIAHSSASIASGTCRMLGKCFRNRRKISGFQNSGCRPMKSS